MLPGVGAFKDAMDGLQERNLVEPIINHIKKRNFFGDLPRPSIAFYQEL